jgi:hypothetical protein
VKLFNKLISGYLTDVDETLSLAVRELLLPAGAAEQLF